MNLLDAVILGLVEGVTEFLPVSSTGHLIITAHLLGLDDQKRAVDAFNIMIQGGAILAVAGVFWPRIRQMFEGLTGRNPIGLRLLANLLIAFLPAAVAGVLLADIVEEYLFYAGPVTAALFLGGVALLLLRKWQRRFFRETSGAGRKPAVPDDLHSYVDLEHLTWPRALIIGLLQVVAMWPGTSRSMMTMIGGMLVGLKARDAAEFSFLLGIPTLGGACAYKAFQTFVVDERNIFEELGAGPVLLGAAVAMLAAAAAVKWLIAYLTRHGFALFGWYRIGLSIAMIILILTGWVSITPEQEISPAQVPAINLPDGQ